MQMAEYLAKRGYAVNMVDLRGFGHSGGQRINEPTIKILTDIETLLRTCCEKDLPTFLIAHGLGALLLNALLQENKDLPIAGVICITPLTNFVNNNRSFRLQRLLLKISPTVFSHLLVHNMLNPTALAKDPLAIKSQIDGTFWENFITLKMADEYEQVGEKLRSEGYKFCYPTLFCCGAKDLVQDFQELKTYFNSLSSTDKQLITFR
jgi:alpha-beta hydrolase superfamily lysophospholipase